MTGLSYFFSLKKTKLDDFDPVVPVLPDVNNFEVENEATVERHLPASIEQGLPTAIEHAAVVAEGSAKVVPDNADATGGTIEYQSELQQETSVQETAADSVSSSKYAVHEVETEVEADTHGADVATTLKNDLTAKELPATEQPVFDTTEVFIFNSCENALADLVQPLRVTLPNL